MPPHGENPLAWFVQALGRDDGFSVGNPRRSDEGGLVGLPILRSRRRSRSYVLATEVSGGLSAIDVGRIDRLRVRNESGVRVLLPPGTLFEGRGTAARGTCAGVVLEPATTREIDVRCVQAAQPICEGASLRLADDLATLPVPQALLSRDQGLVWETVGTAPRPVASPRRVETGSEEAQCGVLLLDARGVVAVEWYDHPETWRTWPRPQACVRDGTPSPALDLADARRVAREFLERLLRRPYRAATRESEVAVDASAAWTIAGGDLLHLIAFGRDLTSRGPAAIADGAFTLPPSGGLIPPLDAPSPGTAGSEGADVAVAEVAVADPVGDPDEVPAVRLRRRKVLTSGWDPLTFESLERYSRKECRGDRSAAIRFLVRRELRQRGYLGPGRAPESAGVPLAEEQDALPRIERERAMAETRIRDLGRIAETDAYAGWLRTRARLELERMAATSTNDALRSAAHSALDRLPADVVFEEGPEPEGSESEAPLPPAPPPLDVRPLLRRAFGASATGRYPEALTLFDEILLAEPDNRTALLGRAVALRRSGKAQEALDALDVVLRVEPTNAAALLSRARILQERGAFEEALDALDRLAAVAPNDWDVWMVRGEVLGRMGRDVDALRAFSEAQRRNPDDEAIRTRIRQLQAARSARAPPAVALLALPHDVQEGQSYLVEEPRPDRSLRVFRALLARGVPALLITRRPPEGVRREAGIAGARILELSHAPGDGRLDPTALVALTRVVEHFVREGHGHAVVLLDGLGSLAAENSPREAILFVERVHETILQSRAIFLVSLPPGDLEEREVAFLERSLRVLP